MIRLAVLDLVLLTLALVLVFVIGSGFLLLSHPSALRHPFRWIGQTYTLRRWLTNPFKLCLFGMLWQSNFQQLVLTGPVGSLAGDLDYRGRIWLTLANFVGTALCFYALHVRDIEQSLWLELSGYISLIGTLGMWVALTYITVPMPNTSYGLNITEGVVLGCLIRSVLILRYKRAVRRSHNSRPRLRIAVEGEHL